MYDIITLGSATVDVFADTASHLVKFITPEGEKDLIAYQSGSKILISDLEFYVGGGGTNTAVSFSRLGLRTAYAGKIGADENGYKVLHLLEEENIDFLGSKDGQTGYSIILDSIEHDRTILTFKGANNYLQEHELPETSAKWLYLSSMIDTSYKSSVVFAKKLHAQGTRIAFNPSNYQAKQGYARLKSLLDITYILVLNKEEAELLLGKQGDCAHLATLLGHKNIPYVVVTDGPRGAVCYHEHQLYTITPTPNLSVLESTGAGDAFASGFVAGIEKAMSVQDALKLGMVQAESVIQAPGAKNQLLDYERAAQHMQAFSGTLRQEEAPAVLHAQNLLEGLPGKGPASVEHEAFIFANGKEVQTLEELAYYLKFIQEEIFLKHLHESTNDFALWIEHALHLPELALQVSQLSNQYVMSKHLIQYLHQVHQ